MTKQEHTCNPNTYPDCCYPDPERSNIEIVTFTGVDESVFMGELEEIAEAYPKVEFGVLVGTATERRPGGIFPPVYVVRLLQRTPVQSAIHLCGSWARRVTDVWGREEIQTLAQGFERVQVNLHGDEWNTGRIGVDVEAVKALAELIAPAKVILQHRGTFSDVPLHHEGVEYLFDISEGGGIESFDHWPAPIHPRVGYAGGLGPHNIRRAVEWAERWKDWRLWFDMEGRIRKDGWLDLEAVREVCRQVWPDRETPA